MDSILKNLNLIDLVSENHFKLRKMSEDLWKESRDYEMSHSEAHLLAKAYYSPITISEASRLLNISRQATQKCAVKLEERGFVRFEYRQGNKRDKHIILTQKGVDYCVDSNQMKQEIEDSIAGILGEKQVKTLKELLVRTWDIGD